MCIRDSNNMKQTIFFLGTIAVVSVIACSSCTKSSSDSAKSPVGTWRWIDTYFVYPPNDSNPKTPVNTGNTELLILNSNNTFKRIMNNMTYDSGTYIYGHGVYINPSSSRFEYDSILYYHVGNATPLGRDYYGFSSDTLIIGSYYADQFGGCYNMPYNGSKWWVKK